MPQKGLHTAAPVFFNAMPFSMLMLITLYLFLLEHWQRHYRAKPPRLQYTYILPLTGREHSLDDIADRFSTIKPGKLIKPTAYFATQSH